MENKYIRCSLYVSVIVVVIAIIYHVTLNYTLTNIDDYTYTALNNYVNSGFSRLGLRWALTNVDQGIWMPLTWLSYMADYHFFGGSAAWMHLHNVILHIGNTIIFFLLLTFIVLKCETQKRNMPSFKSELVPYVQFVIFLVVAFWAWHPLRVEPVTWVASRKDVLFTFWELIALFAWTLRIHYAERIIPVTLLIVLSFSTFILSCMSKPAAMTFPLIALLIEWLYRGSIRWRDYYYMGIVALLIAGLASHAQKSAGATTFLADVPFYGLLANAIASFGIYLWKTIWPFDLAVQCMNQWPLWPRFFVPGSLICMAFAGLFFVLFMKVGGFSLIKGKISRCSFLNRLFFVGLLLFSIAVAPTLGLMPFGYHSYADRFTYFPSIGLSLVLLSILLKVQQKRNLLISLQLGGIVILMSIVWITHRQLTFWRDDGTLYTRTIQVDGDRNTVAHGVLGVYYYDHKHGDPLVLEHFSKAYDCPENKRFRFFIPYYSAALVDAGRFDEAADVIRTFSESESKGMNGEFTQLNQTIYINGLSFLMYAKLSLAKGEYEIAEDHLQRYEKCTSDSPDLLYLQGLLAQAKGQSEIAKTYWKKCMHRPDSYVKYVFLQQHMQ